MEPRPEWIGVVVRYPDGSMRAIEMSDDGTDCLGDPEWTVSRPYMHLATTTMVTLTTRGAWYLYVHDGPTADPFKASTAIAAAPDERKAVTP